MWSRCRRRYPSSGRLERVVVVYHGLDGRGQIAVVVADGQRHRLARGALDLEGGPRETLVKLLLEEETRTLGRSAAVAQGQQGVLGRTTCVNDMEVPIPEVSTTSAPAFPDWCSSARAGRGCSIRR